uniref:Uncharacterized protein n=1 Tax=Streptomyces sp. NBC_00008 TaxID=2903610 RepID=A0AAU2VVF3_9ACTN
MHFDTESVGTEPHTAEDPGRQGQVPGASASEIANSGAFDGGYPGALMTVEIVFETHSTTTDNEAGIATG